METLDQNVRTAAADLTVEARSNLSTASGWAKFVGITMFVFTGLMLILTIWMFIMAASMSFGSSQFMMMGIMYLFMVVLYFFMSKFVFDFGNSTKKGLQNNSEEMIEKGIRGLKNHFLMMGVLMIIGLGLMFIGLLFGGVASFIR